ncbi:DUF4976 domain-containing protein [candidate division KSB1 bacterium]|nr:sulfatase-like hydrolase/transferase [candidate division KSB1 bacterium]RQW04949.1 MAG: DUF4976 domain-containing protein [candidate division KSB1 bacterium]
MRSSTRREFLKKSAKTAAALGSGVAISGCQHRHQQPNILFIFSDQQHWSALGFMDSFFDTPNLDAFARDSVVFEKTFCSTPQCSPSRSSMLTGFYPHKTGVYGNIGAAGGEPLKQPTIAKKLRQHGYKTAYVGKWHLGPEQIARQDFDFFLLKDKSRGETSDPLTTADGLKLLNDPGFTSGPFALFLSYVDPHDIYGFRDHTVTKGARIDLPASWDQQNFAAVPAVQKQFMTEDQGTAIWGAPRAVWQQYHDCYRSKVKLYDDHFGRIINALKTNGLWENTIVINTSDHGDMDTHNHLIWKGPFMYEHLVRIPLMIRLPEQFGGQNNRRIQNLDVVNVDFVPTVLSLCGIPAGHTDGLSLQPILLGKKGQQTREFVISEYYSKQKWVNPIRMIRTAEFKYTLYIRHGEELYDLGNDPDELRNVAQDADYAGIKKQLKAQLQEWIRQQHDPFFALRSTDRAGKII